MSEGNKSDTPQNGNLPSHIVWHVPSRENTPWTRIGAQWPTRSGAGFNQVLNYIPQAPGHIVVMPNIQGAKWEGEGTTQSDDRPQSESASGANGSTDSESK